MAETVITKVIDVQTGKAITNIKDLKKEIRDLKSYLATLDKSSEEYTKALLKLNQAETQFNNLQKVSQQNTQQLANQLASLSKIGSGLAGGFSALNGILSLLGKSGDDLSKTLVKLQSGIAIVQGIGGLQGLAESLPKIKNWFDNLRDSVSDFFAELTPFDSRIKQSAEALNQLKVDLPDIDIQASAGGNKEITQVNQAIQQQGQTVAGTTEQWNKYYKEYESGRQAVSTWTEDFKRYIDFFEEYNKTAVEAAKVNVDTIKQLSDEFAKTGKGDELAEYLRNLVLDEDAVTKAAEAMNEPLEDVVYTLTHFQDWVQNDSDALKELQNQLDAAPGKLNKVGSAIKSLFSTVGWTVLVSLITAAVFKLIDYVKTLKTAAQAQIEFNKAIRESTAEISSKSVAAFNELIAVYDTFDDKAEFLKEYSEQIKQTGLKINDVTDAENAFINNTENYKNAIIARAQIDAYRDKINEKTKELLDYQFEAESKLSEINRRIAATGGLNVEGLIGDRDALLKEQKKRLKDYDKFVYDITDRIKGLTDNYKSFWATDNKETGSTAAIKSETDKDLEIIKSFIKASEELLRDDKDNSLILLDEKYAGMLELAEKYGLDSTAIQEAYDKERYEITKKYNQLVIDDTEKANQKNWDDFQKELARIRNLSDTSNLREPKEQQFTTRYAQKASRLVGGGFDRNEVFTYQSKEDIQNQYAAQIKYNNDLFNLTKQRIDQENALLEEQLNNDQLTADQRLEIERTLRENKMALSDAELKNEQDNAKAYDDVQSKKRQALQATLSVASSVSGSIASFAKTESENDKLSEKQRKAAFATYKASAVSQAIMDTYAAANSSYQSMASIPYVGPFLGAAAAAAAIASGIANVRQILSTQMSSTSVNASTVTPPNVDTNVEYTRNLLSDREIDEINKPTKVYVTEKDITDMQNKVKVVSGNATF